MKRGKHYLLGIDVGGTFTDLVLCSNDGLACGKKVPSATGDDYDAVASGIQVLFSDHGVDPCDVRYVVHGATVATNTVLQLKGAKTALLTTKGFRDVLELRRIRYPDRYNPFWRKPPPLIPRRLRREVTERLDASGRVILELDLDSVRSTLRQLLDKEHVESVAVCLLHSHVNPIHEERIEQLLRDEFPEVCVSISSKLVPMAGEYERTSTVVCDAYVKPVVTRYQSQLVQSLQQLGISAPLFIMQSSGGMMSAQLSIERPVFGLESGPAAGVMAASALSRLLRENHAIAFDMGGTTAKASMIEYGEPSRTTEYEIGARASMGSRLLKGGGYLLKVRSVDVAEVGAGGGSLVSLDAGGGMHVGPESAGAIPGPACYDRGGTQPTIADANLLLGYLNPAVLLGGALRVDYQRARAVWIDRIAGPLGTSVERSAYGAHILANASMERAIRLVSTERGLDVRRAALIAFGGSGPVHAASLAESMGIRKVIIPRGAGVFSAVGLLTVPFSHEFTQGVFGRVGASDHVGLERVFQQLEAVAHAELMGGNGSSGRVSFVRYADVRYTNEHRELTVRLHGRPVTQQQLGDVERAFHADHRRTFGYRTHEPISIENLRIVATVRGGAVPIASALAHLEGGEVPKGREGRRMTWFGDVHGWVESDVVARDVLTHGPRTGPLIIEEYDTTIVVPPSFETRLDDTGNVVLETIGASGLSPDKEVARIPGMARDGGGLPR